ncbi:MAG: Nucleoside transporter, NupC family [candidate division TM6 bacterium GW2011_GWF2_30_66]|nr:MAG: Nucleoside transporter, NupC family [candidate division TM6 bacterium GW2011_GWF2_30_66]
MIFNSVLDYFLEHNRYLNILGILFILFVAWIFSRKRSHINFRLVLSALFLQFVVGILVLKTSAGLYIMNKMAVGVEKVYECANEGLKFVFGKLVDDSMPWGAIFAVKILPVIIFFGALMALLYHFRIIQFFVLALSYIIRPILGTSGAETLCAITNSFLGQTEAPLLIKNYLHDMTKSEFMLVMISGMATISGAILVVFSQMGVPIQHLLSASAMAIPGAILISKILLPETEKPKTLEGANIKLEKDSHNMFDAIFVGTSDGLQLALNVGAMLIVFLALMAMLNSVMGVVSLQVYSLLGLDWPELSMNLIFSYLFAPFSYLLGFVGQEAMKVGGLLGTKVVVNELLAYKSLVAEQLSPRTTSIVTYALCGFSNFSCIGIQIGGIGGLVPGKKLWLTQLGLYAVLGGTLSNLMSAMIASLLI